MGFTIKKFSIAITFLITSAIAYCAEDFNAQLIGPFSGLNNYDNSAAIPAEKAQDLLNVDISLGGKSVKKRKGFGIFTNLSITTSPVHGIYTFNDSNGNSVDLYFNDTRMSASINGTSPNVIFSTGSFGATYQCADSAGLAYCANTARNSLFRTDGVTAFPIVNVYSTGTMVAVTQDRLAMSGFAEAPNRIDFSQSAGLSTFIGTSILGTDPIQITINSPGPKITHITYAFGRLMWFKNTSFGYILFGPNLSDWTVRIVSPNIGTNDNTSVYYQGILYFKASDGHYYGFDGSNLLKMSREIGGTTAQSQTRTSNVFNQTTQADFGNGVYLPSNYIDTSTASGLIQFIYPDDFSSFRDGTNGKSNYWLAWCAISCTSDSVSTNGNLLMHAMSASGQDQLIGSRNPSSNYKTGTTFYVLISSISTASGGQSSFRIGFSSSTKISGSFPGVQNDYFYLNFQSTVSNKAYLNEIKNSQDLSLCFNNCMSGNFSVPAEINVFMATTTYQVTINGVVQKSGTHSYTNNQVYSYIDYFNGLTSGGYLYLDTYAVSPQTSTYLSPVKNAPNLTSWDQFDASISGSTQTFYIRSSNSVFTQTAVSPSWTLLPKGSVPTISTGSYFQIRDDIVASTFTSMPTLTDFSQYWFEGSATDKSYATYFNDAIWFSATVGTGATTNNRIVKWDLINDTYILYDIPSNGFLVRNNDLYFGSSTEGKIFKFGTGDNDNGLPINSFWKSKDFFNSSPFTDDEVVNISVANSGIANSSMTITYTLNGSSSTSFVVPCYRSGSSFVQTNRNTPAGKIGNTFNVQFGNNATDQPFEVFVIQYGTRPRPWIPTNP